MDAVVNMPPPPLPPQPAEVFAALPDLSQLSLDASLLQLPQPPEGTTWQPRIGRGGRLILDRCRPFTLEAIDDAVRSLK
jgi:hypothetical protein